MPAEAKQLRRMLSRRNFNVIEMTVNSLRNANVYVFTITIICTRNFLDMAKNYWSDDNYLFYNNLK